MSFVNTRVIWRALLPAERVLIYFTIFCCVLNLLIGIPARPPAQLYLHRLSTGLVLYFVTLIIVVLITRLDNIRSVLSTKRKLRWKDTWREFTNDYLVKSKIFWSLRHLNIIAVFFTLFINLKHLIPWVNPRLFDSELEGLERSLFAGAILSERFINWFSIDAAYILSACYNAFYGYIVFIIFYFLMIPNRKLAESFFLFFVILWLQGLLWIYAFPTVGPCFYLPELFAQLPHTRMQELQQGLRDLQEYTQNFPLSERGVFMISGFPSIHLALPLGASWYLWQHSKSIGILSYLFSLITVVTTIYFGWHWLIDDLGSIFLAWSSVYLCKIILERDN